MTIKSKHFGTAKTNNTSPRRVGQGFKLRTRVRAGTEIGKAIPITSIKIENEGF